MIGRLAGHIGYISDDHVLIDVGGVGYIVYCSSRTMAVLPPPGKPVTLFTDLLVREDLMQLFGFESLIEKEWHRLLTRVQGVGAKVSLAILGTLGPDGVSRAIALEDAGAVKQAPGVGPKLAARIVAELKDKAPGIMALGANLPGAGAAHAPSASTPSPAPAESSVGGVGAEAEPPALARQTAQSDALSALLNLGYERSEAAAAIMRAGQDQTVADDTALLIRAALKALGPEDRP